jgi:lipopolysaccharide export system protein LptA
MITQRDTLKTTLVVKANDADSSIRYFLGFHNVRIFNDSLQAVSDSLHYSTLDSTFKLFGEPVVWNDKSQVTGDTLYVYTQNQKPRRLYVFNNGMIINKTKEGLYNQIAGRTLNGYFIDGSIDYVRVKGSPAESIFYPQGDDSAYIGMNRSSGDVIDVYFVKKELNKVKFINNVDGVLYPMKDIPADKKELKGFKWLDNRRPKNKLELFE